MARNIGLRHIGLGRVRGRLARLGHLPALAALAIAGLLVAGSSIPVKPAPAALSAAETRPGGGAEVVGYLPYWELDAATAASLDYERLTTIVLFSVGMNSKGRLVTSAPGYSALMSDAATAVIDAAHAAGVKVLVSFTSFGSAKNARFFGNPSARQTFVDEAAEIVAARGLDGADFDVESLGSAHYDEFAATAGALAGVIRRTNPLAYSTVATNGNVSGSRMAAQALASGVDRVFLMGYNYRTAATDPVGSIDPLVRPDGRLSLSSSLDLYRAQRVPLDRVLLGLPLYGRTWQTVDSSVRSQRVGGTRGELFLLRDLGELRAEGRILADDFDVEESSARLVRQIGGRVYQTYYDSPRSLGEKFDLAFERGLAGIGFWTLGYDGGKGAHWDLIPKAGEASRSQLRAAGGPAG